MLLCAGYMIILSLLIYNESKRAHYWCQQKFSMIN